MRVYALCGPSGTGKSTSALQVAHQLNIEAIIDDGLLIIEGQKVAGTSAKFEKNTITAVRRAIFQDDAHQRAVLEALVQYRVQSILIIGTSIKMINKIATRLGYQQIDELLYVEDVRTKKEIEMAKFVRETQGKHVMPIPYRQVEQNFFKRLVQRGMDIFSPNKEKIGETTIVRPDFHNETIDISKAAYLQVITYTVEHFDKIVKVEHVKVDIQVPLPVISFTITITAPVDYEVPTMIKELQHKVYTSFAQHFTIEPSTIDIYIKGIETTKARGQ